MSEIEDAIKTEQEINDLRRALRKAQIDLSRAKSKSFEFHQAVVESCREAHLAAGKPKAITPPAKDRRKRSEEVALWHITDLQTGKKTATYDMAKMDARVREFASKAIHITEMVRTVRPVRHCEILLGGDMVENTTIFPGQVWEVEATTFNQLLASANALEAVFNLALANYETIEVVCEPGNHGRIGMKSDGVPKGDNWDRILYQVVSERFTHEKRIAFKTRDHWYQEFSIGNYHAILVHGDEYKSFGGNTPVYGILKKTNAWKGGVIPHFQDAYCVDPLTEALTPHGWRSYDQIGSLPIATLNPETLAFEWQIPSRIFVGQHDGPMVHHIGRSMDHFATEDHDMYVAHHGAKWFHKVKAAQVPASTNWLYRAAADSWAGLNVLPSIPDCLKGADPFDIVALIGWYVSEGHASEYQVAIAQSREKKPDYHKEIMELFSRLGFTPNSQPAYVRVCSTALAGWLRTQCGHLAPNKRFPAWIKRSDSSLIDMALSTACKGDGHVGPTGLVHYYTSSEHMVDDVQEMALKIGMSTSVVKRPARGHGKLPTYQISLSTHPVRRMATTKNVVEYSGTIWCPTVENGLWFMRRNGKVMVTGNCGHYHNHNDLSLAAGGMVYMTGSTESDNEFAREFVAASAIPSQRLHFVNPEAGRVTSQYKIELT